MFENKKISMPPKPQNSRDTQVLRSISAQSAISLDQNQAEQLMMKQLLLSIQLDRKDTIIRELLQLVEGDDSKRIIEQLNIKCSKLEIENKTLKETNIMLKKDISSIESAKSNQMFTSMSQITQELQHKVMTLETKLRNVQNQKIDLEQQMKKSRIDKTMQEYKYFESKHNQKNRIRQLQTQLASQRAKNQNERKTIYEKNILLDQFKNKLIEYQNREKIISAQYQQKLRTYHSQMIYHQNLKKSQISSNQQRVNSLLQQVNNQAQEIRHLKNSNDQLRDTIQSKDRQINKLVSESRTVESNLIRVENNYKDVNSRLQSVTSQLKTKEKQIHDKSISVQKLSSQIEQMKYMYTNKGQQVNLHIAEMTRLRTQNIELQAQVKNQNMEIRRLKRKPSVLCQNCQAKQLGSSSYISSQKSIKSLNIGEIIEQTEQLFKSNRKMQSLISRHQSVIESSIHLYPPHHQLDL